MKTLLRSGFLVLAIMALAVPVDAGPYDDGVTAYLDGDYRQAVKWYRMAAEQGGVVAQDNLGRMYRSGNGVPQDYVFAHMWFNLAGAQAKIFGRSRDEVAELMTPDQIAEAQRMAHEWMAKHQQ